MTGALRGVRGRVTMLVLAVTACLYSLLGAIGFIRIANGGRTAIRDRVATVVDQLEAGLRSGSSTVRITTPDGVEAFATTSKDARSSFGADEIVVERTVTVGSATVQLFGHASQARLSDSLHSLWRGLWVAVPAASIISAAMAGVATARALRPVEEIVGFVGAIGANDTTTRVPNPDTGDEIELLAHTVNGMLERVAEGRLVQQQFSSDAAHELRTPLMALQAEIELAGGPNAIADPELFARLDALARRLRARVDDLVLLSTLDEARPRATTVVSLRRVCEDEAAAMARPVDVRGDEDLLRRAVRNLLANATRHAHEHVRVTVGELAGGAVVHVDDDGPGVPVGSRTRVFERFARLDASRAADAGGAGLGLAIVASVVARHGGAASVTDSPLGGARFTMTFPRGADE